MKNKSCFGNENKMTYLSSETNPVNAHFSKYGHRKYKCKDLSFTSLEILEQFSNPIYWRINSYGHLPLTNLCS